MNETKSILPVKIGGAEITRFNALRHGVLSRYTVLPWEDAAEYRDLVASPVAEHAPHGPTEEHLVEELAGILWRKRRLRLAEAAAQGTGLKMRFRNRTALRRERSYIDAADGSEDVAEAVRATAADTELAPQRPLRGRDGGAARGHATMVGRHATSDRFPARASFRRWRPALFVDHAPTAKQGSVRPERRVRVGRFQPALELSGVRFSASTAPLNW